MRPLCSLCLVAAVLGSYPPRHLEPALNPDHWGIPDVQSWVRSIGYAEYVGAFSEAQIDGPKLLTLSAESLQAELIIASPEHALVIEMEVSSLRLRRGLMSAAEERQYRKAHPSPFDWGVSDVVAFLEELGLGAYSKAFSKRKIDGPMLLQLQQDSLASLLNISPNKFEANENALELLTAAVSLLKRRVPRSHARDEL